MITDLALPIHITLPPLRNVHLPIPIQIQDVAVVI